VQGKVKVEGQGRASAAIEGALLIDQRRRVCALRVDTANGVQLHDGDAVTVMREGRPAEIVADGKPLVLKGKLFVAWDLDAVGVLVGEHLCPLAGGETLRAG